MRHQCERDLREPVPWGATRTGAARHDALGRIAEAASRCVMVCIAPQMLSGRYDSTTAEIFRRSPRVSVGHAAVVLDHVLRLAVLTAAARPPRCGCRCIVHWGVHQGLMALWCAAASCRAAGLRAVDFHLGLCRVMLIQSEGVLHVCVRGHARGWCWCGVDHAS